MREVNFYLVFTWSVNVKKNKGRLDNLVRVKKLNPVFALLTFCLSQNGVRSNVRVRIRQSLARLASYPARNNV